MRSTSRIWAAAARFTSNVGMRAMFHSRGASVDANPSPEARRAREWTQLLRNVVGMILNTSLRTIRLI